MVKNNKPNRPLTEVELELMSVIWGLAECTVRDVVDRLPKRRALAYTSVATMMKILEHKGFLKSAKGEKTHVYSPLVPRETYEQASLKYLADRLFQGNPSSMVMRLLDDSELTREELKQIRKTLEGRLRS